VITALFSRGTRTHDRRRAGARQPAVRSRTAAMKTRTKTSWRRIVFAMHRILLEPEKPRPRSAAADRGLV